MQSFRDNAGRAWAVVVNVATVKRVRALAGVDLYGLVDDRFKGLGKLLADPVTLVDVLYVIVKDEADKAGVTDEQFGAAMAGDAIQSAADAFTEALFDFFPDPRVRAGLRKIAEAGKTLRATMLDRMEAELTRINPDSLAKTLSGRSGGSRGSSGSTRRRSRSGNSR